MTRPVRIEGDVAYVPLTQGYEAIVDRQDVHRVSAYDWYAKIARRRDGTIKVVYAARNVGIGGGRQQTVRMHRAIMNPSDDLDVDHRDGDGLNNRRSNLRVATKLQNSQNRRKNVNNTSGVKGVSWNRRDGKWHAKISMRGREQFIGYFSDIDEAAAAYAAASAKLHGEFGRTA